MRAALGRCYDSTAVKNVIALVGSPRKGHTRALVEQLGARLRALGDVRLEVVQLGDVDLRPCRGCYNCQSRGELRCPLRDDLAALVARMRAADGVILASPTYTSNVSGLMKTFMDRMAWAAHRPPFLGKPAVLVATASALTGGALRALSWFRYTGLDVVAEVGRSVWPSPRRDWVRAARDERALRRAAERLWRAMSEPRTALTLAQVIQFYVGKTTPATDPEFFVADEAYHRDIDALGLEVAPWKKALGELSFRLVAGVNARWLGVKPPRPRAPAAHGEAGPTPCDDDGACAQGDDDPRGAR